MQSLVHKAYVKVLFRHELHVDQMKTAITNPLVYLKVMQIIVSEIRTSLLQYYPYFNFFLSSSKLMMILKLSSVHCN